MIYLYKLIIVGIVHLKFQQKYKRLKINIVKSFFIWFVSLKKLWKKVQPILKIVKLGASV